MAFEHSKYLHLRNARVRTDHDLSPILTVAARDNIRLLVLTGEILPEDVTPADYRCLAKQLQVAQDQGLNVVCTVALHTLTISHEWLRQLATQDLLILLEPFNVNLHARWQQWQPDLGGHYVDIGGLRILAAGDLVLPSTTLPEHCMDQLRALTQTADKHTIAITAETFPTSGDNSLVEGLWIAVQYGWTHLLGLSHASKAQCFLVDIDEALRQTVVEVPFTQSLPA